MLSLTGTIQKDCLSSNDRTQPDYVIGASFDG